MVQFRQHINSAFYVRYSYAYVIVNIETRLKMVLDRQPLFGTGPLAGWLYNLVHGRTGPREALDTFIEAHKP